MSQELNFTYDNGPVMQGTWINRKTGDIFTVADCFFQDNQLMVKTTDGRMLDYNFFSSYEQTKSEKEAREMAKVIKEGNTDPQPMHDIPAEVADLLEQPLKPTPLGSIAQPLAAQPVPRPEFNPNLNMPKIKDQDIIERALGEQPMPLLDCATKWKDMPIQNIKALTDMMGVDVQDIVSWYISQLDLDAVRICIEEHLKKVFEDALNVKLEKEPEPEKKPESTPKKSSSTKKSKNSSTKKK